MIISNILLRTVPEHLMAGVSSGQLEVLGSIIRSTSSGKIVAHLQEAAPLANLLARAPLDLVIAPLDLAAQAIQIGQNEQIKAGIDALRELQTAGLVLNAASIGVSVAGFARSMRCKRISERFTRNFKGSILSLMRSGKNLGKGIVRA